MPRTPGVATRLAVPGLKLAVLGAVALLAVRPGLTTSASDLADPAPGSITSDVSNAAPPSRLDRLMTRHDCSATGFGPDVVPASALVERDGRVRLVSFDEGWAIYTGEVNGSLLAVCKAKV